MKIIGFVYQEKRSDIPCQPSGSKGEWEMVLKADSCLLNGRKPFFLPDWSQEVGYTPCLILRVSRLGKEIAPKFANRYYDAVAYGADFTATDILREAQAAGRPWTRAMAFDYSLAIGEFKVESSGLKEAGELNDERYSGYVLTPAKAIAEASKLMTIRQGDLIVIQAHEKPKPVHKEDIIRVEENGKELLYCKIK